MNGDPTVKSRTFNYDSAIERGITFLLIFTPLALGSVQAWSAAIMEITALLVFSLWLVKRISGPAPAMGWSAPGFQRPPVMLFAFPLVLLGVALFQVLPLPGPMLSVLSPRTAALYRSFLDNPDVTWRTVSVHPAATVQAVFRALSYGMVFIVIASHYDREARIRRLFQTVILMGCFLAIVAVAMKIAGNGRLFWVFTMPGGTSFFGPYINKNHFAGYMEMAVPVGLGSYLYTVSRMRGKSDRAGMPLQKKVAAFLDDEKLMPLSLGLVCVIIMTGALFLTLSRGGIAAFLASLIFFAWLARSRRSLRKKWNYVLLMGVVMALAVVMAAWTMIEARMETVAQQSVTRTDTWQDSIPIVRDFPLLGTGLGTFPDIFPLYQSKHSLLFFEHAENDYIELLTDTGVAGFAALLALVAVFSYAVYKRWRERHNPYVVCAAAGGMASCVAITVHSLTDFNMHVPANAMLLTIIAAATYAAVFNVKSGRQPGPATEQGKHEVA